MLFNLLLIMGLIVAGVVLKLSLEELIDKGRFGLTKSMLSTVVAVSIVSGVFIFVQVRSIGPVSFVIALLGASLLFFSSILIVQDEK